MPIPPICPLVKPENLSNLFGQGGWSWDNPVGVTIHYSADRKIDRAITWLKSQNFGYHIFIDRDGTLHQTCHFNQRVNHAGNSRWKGLKNNFHHIAVCIASWGLLECRDEKFYTWSKKTLHLESVVMREDYKGNIKAWDKATVEQEASLHVLLTWLVANGIESESICGHDESCIPEGHKSDPGGILSLSVKEIRDYFSKGESK